MTSTSSHSVPASAAGIAYQFDRALLLLSEARGGSVGIETHDDVARTTSDLERWEQDKLSFQNSGHPLTNKSKNLWNTLNIWIQKLAETATPIDRVELSLVTNRPVPSCLIRMISDANDNQAAAACVEVMRTISSEDEAVQELIDVVLAQSDAFLIAFVQRITLFDGGIGTSPTTISQAIIQNLQCPNWVNSNTVVQALSGWIHNIVMSLWTARLPAWVTHEAFNQRKHELFYELRQQRHRERPENEVLLTADQRAAASVRRFVEHLSAVDVDLEELSQAVDDFLRFETEQFRLLLAGEVTNQHWEGFFITLRRRWKTIQTKHLRHPNGRSAEDLGHDVLSETCDNEYLAPLAGSPTHQTYLTCGGYHALADDDKIWWHPAAISQPAAGNT